MADLAFDLQSHSIYSDGELSPAEVVAYAARAGVQLLALTDHDSVDGVAEAAVAAEQHDLRLVPAVEISVLDPAGADLHMCAYGVDITNSGLLQQLQRSRADRQARAQRMTDKLEELGWAVDHTQLQERIATGGTVGRPHIAAAVVTHPGNSARLAAEGLTEPSAFLVAYLIEGKPAFSDRIAPTVAEAVNLVHGAGGVAVWAHPFWDIPDHAGVLQTLDRFVAAGIDGVEAFYVTHTREQTELLVQRCAELGLLTTGSTDFHGPHHRQFTQFRGFETYGLEPNLGVIAA